MNKQPTPGVSAKEFMSSLEKFCKALRDAKRLRRVSEVKEKP